MSPNQNTEVTSLEQRIFAYWHTPGWKFRVSKFIPTIDIDNGEIVKDYIDLTEPPVLQTVPEHSICDFKEEEIQLLISSIEDDVDTYTVNMDMDTDPEEFLQDISQSFDFSSNSEPIEIPDATDVDLDEKNSSSDEEFVELRETDTPSIPPRQYHRETILLNAMIGSAG